MRRTCCSSTSWLRFFTAVRRPNPNAAAVFINWFASKEAQEIFERENLETSMRTDVSHKVPDYVIPKPGVEYPIDDYDPDYFFTKRAPIISRLQQILGR